MLKGRLRIIERNRIIEKEKRMHDWLSARNLDLSSDEISICCFKSPIYVLIGHNGRPRIAPPMNYAIRNPLTRLAENIDYRRGLSRGPQAATDRFLASA